MKKANRRANVSSRLLRAAVVLILPVTVFAGAPVLSGVNPTLTPSIAMGNPNPPGYTDSTFLNPIVTDGTLLDNFDNNTAVSKWGGTWLTFNDAGGGGLSVVTPPVLTFTASAPGYNSAYCGKVTAALHQGLIVGYNPYVGLTVNLNPTATLPVDLTKATGFQYWFKGGKHYFKMETSDINPGAASYYQDSVPASATWKLVVFTWDSLHSVNYGSGVVSPVSAASKKLAMRLSWVIQGPDGTIDSVLIDNVQVTGFADRGIAVTGADNTNGAWQFSTNAGTTWTPFGALSDNSATLLNAAAQVRFVPAAAYSGPSTFIFRAWNQTDGKANGSVGQIVAPNGTVTPYSALSATATVQVANANTPAIQTNPASVTVNEGATLTLSVTATNATAYQWKKAGVAIAGATGTTYTKNPVAVSDAGTYTVMVKNATDSVESQQATVTVIAKPANATVTPALDTLLVSGSVTFTVNPAIGTGPFTYQWRKDDVTIPGQTAKTYAIASAVLLDAGTYTAVVTNAAGSTTSSGGVLVVNTPIKAIFIMSDSIIKVPKVITFTDQSTGGAQITKRIWYFGDGAVDSIDLNPTHEYDSTGVFTVKLVVMKGAVRQDSMIRYVKAHKDNPIAIQGRYVPSGKAEITFSNYGSQLISTGIGSFPYADSMKLWYQSGSVPTSATGATPCAEVSIAAMQAAPVPFKDTVPVTLAGSDTAAGFMTQVHWNDGTTWYWSNFDQGNGTLVIMSDTTTPVNIVSIAGNWLQGTNSVNFSLSGLNGLDAASIDSFGIWFGTSTTDTVPNFGNATNTRWFKLSALSAMITANGGHDTIGVANALFNTGTQKKLLCAVALKGKNHKQSSANTSYFLAGENRPANPIFLTAKAMSPSVILLSWRPVGNSVSSIRFWYSTTGKVPVNQTDFTSPPYDSISAVSVLDTQLAVSNLTGPTTYYFGGQVFWDGQWSFVTDSASASATTPPPSGKLPVNTVKITSLTFDTVNNAIHVKWNVTKTVLDTLEIGISYSLSGYPTADTSVHQIVSVNAPTGDTVVKLREPLVFSASTADTTFYYVALWERRVNGTLTDPTDSSEMRVASPTYNWQQVTYFTKSPGDTNSVFNGNILIVTDSVAVADVTPTVGVIRYFSGLTPASLPGFVQMSVPFYFSKYQSTAPFTIDLKLFAFPANLTASSVRIYQLKNGLWYVDRSSSANSAFASTRTKPADTLSYTYVALIDTVAPTVKRGFHADTLPPLTDVFDTLYISDNCANVTYAYSFTRGGDAFSNGDADSGTLAALQATIPVVIPSPYVTKENGLRAMVVVSDGVNTVTQNVSRQVLRPDSSDFIMTLQNAWMPLRVTAWLKDSALAPAFGAGWKYDKQQMRLFRWNPGQTNPSSTLNWVEYSDATANDFAMSPGTLVWEKGRTSVPVNFGSGVTPTLRASYAIQLPANSWADFTVPYRFDVRVGEIIDSTGAVADTLQIYSWVQDSASHRYLSSPIFFQAFAIVDKSVVLSSQDFTGYTVFNPLSVPVTLQVPPIPKTMSSYGVAKRTAGSGWVVSVTSNLSDGSKLSPVFCGYSEAKSAATSYFPVPPTFEKAYVGVLDGTKNKVYGHALAHGTAGGGSMFTLAFVNDGDQAAAISYRLANQSPLPKGLVARAFNEKTGSVENFSSGAATVTVAAGGMELRVLAVGTPAYLAKAALVLRSATLAFVGISPNPASSLVRIRYSVPGSGVSSVKFAIYDLRGRMVWQQTVDERGRAGMREIDWDGRSFDRRRVAAGMYVVRMTALDESNRPGGIFEKRMTYLP